MLPNRLSLVTLGVDDLDRARQFYTALGFVPAAVDTPTAVFFQMNGTVLSLYDRTALADDATLPATGSGFRGITIAINFDSAAEVDAALAHAVACGASLVKPAQPVFWGGYSGYFADPDGQLWEIAHNPFWPNDAHGHMRIPLPAKTDGDTTSEAACP